MVWEYSPPSAPDVSDGPASSTDTRNEHCLHLAVYSERLAVHLAYIRLAAAADYELP